VQKVLEADNMCYAPLCDHAGEIVAGDIACVSGRTILALFANGEDDCGKLADLAKGRLRQKRAELEQARVGWLRSAQCLLLSDLLARAQQPLPSAGQPVSEVKLAPGNHQEVAERFDQVAGALVVRHYDCDG
jgi:hypothetical protein